MNEEEMEQIEITLEVQAMLDDLKICPEETYNSIIKRLLLYYNQAREPL